MVQDIENIKSKISKCLATAANDAATPNEKAVAMQMAAALMRRYNLEREDIEDAKKKDDYNEVVVASLWARLTPWESTLASFVSAYIVKGVWCLSSKEGATHRNYGTVGQAQITFVGLGEDARIAAATFHQLRDLLLKQCNAKFGTPVRGYGRSYAVGFVAGLFQVGRENEAKEKADNATKAEMSRALVRTDMLKTQAENWYLAKNKVKVKSSSRSLTGLRNGAYNAGVRDGREANTEKRGSVSGLLN